MYILYSLCCPVGPSTNTCDGPLAQDPLSCTILAKQERRDGLQLNLENYSHFEPSNHQHHQSYTRNRWEIPIHRLSAVSLHGSLRAGDRGLAIEMAEDSSDNAFSFAGPPARSQILHS